MMDKLLHERLRDVSWTAPCAGKALEDAGIGHVACGNLCSDCIARIIRGMAEEIERCYIPREKAEAEKSEIITAQKGSAHHIMKLYADEVGKPMEKGESITRWLDRWFLQRPRYDDGEPVQWGDTVDGYDDPIDCMCIYGDGSGALMNHADNLGSMRGARFGCGFMLKRPAIKLLDADGVEIKAGDTVYNLENDGEQGTVRCLYSYGIGVEWKGGWRSDGVCPQYLTHEQPVFDADGVRICEGDTVWTLSGLKRTVVKTGTELCDGMKKWDGSPWVRFSNGSWMHAKDVSHREPDSLEKLLDYVIDQEEQESGSARDVYRKIENRLTALIERG